MAVRFESTLKMTLTELSRLLNSFFVGYFVPMKFTPASLSENIRIDSLDLDASRLIYLDKEIIGVALIARRGNSSRLAAMAIAPQFRRQGFGRKLLAEIVANEKIRGTDKIFLEVIEQNAPALELYANAGFTRVRRLIGFECEQPVGSSDEAEPVDLREVGLAMIHGAPADLPWQISGESVVQLGPPTLGFRLAEALAAVTIRNHSEIWLRCIVVAPDKRRRGQAIRLLRALLARFPNATWKVGSLFPEDTIGLFEKAGFREHPISQVQMVLALTHERSINELTPEDFGQV